MVLAAKRRKWRVANVTYFRRSAATSMATSFQGLAPLAIGFRPFGAKTPIFRHFLPDPIARPASLAYHPLKWMSILSRVAEGQAL